MSLEGTVGGQMRDNLSLIERIGLYIPIYRGYKEKNLRRDEDRAIRQEVVLTLEGTKNDLESIHLASVDSSDLMRDAERIMAKVDMYYVTVKKGVSGYSGWYASSKILEEELDGLVSWDAKLIDGAVILRNEVGDLVQKMDMGEYAIMTPLKSIERRVDQLIEDYNGRESVMKGFVERG